MNSIKLALAALPALGTSATCAAQTPPAGPRQQWVELRKDDNFVFAADVANPTAGSYAMAVIMTPGGQFDPGNAPGVLKVTGVPDCATGKIAFSGATQANLDVLNSAGVQEKLQYSSGQWKPSICGGKGAAYAAFPDPVTIWSLYKFFDKPAASDEPMGFVGWRPGRMSFFRPLGFRTAISQVIFEVSAPAGSYISAARNVDCSNRRVSSPELMLVDRSGAVSTTARADWVANAKGDDAALLKWSCDELPTISIAFNPAHVDQAFRATIAK